MTIKAVIVLAPDAFDTLIGTLLPTERFAIPDFPGPHVVMLPQQILFVHEAAKAAALAAIDVPRGKQ
jgi:hypothetical protein